MRPFQVLEELIGLRNRYVNPKVRNTQKEYNGQQFVPNAICEKPQGILCLPANEYDWRNQHSTLVLKEVVSFLNFYLLGHCHLSPADCQCLLVSYGEHNGKRAPQIAMHQLDMLANISAHYEVSVDFLPTLNAPKVLATLERYKRANNPDAPCAGPPGCEARNRDG
jgi:hypothetical protein